MPNKDDKDKFGISDMHLLSQAIDLLRFPLALMVIYLHLDTQGALVGNSGFDFTSVAGWETVTRVSVSHVLTHVAVPTFFLISGFLFFRNIENWDWKKYITKLKSRWHSLMLPFLVWILMVFAFTAIQDVINGMTLSNVWTTKSKDFWHIFFDYYTWDTQFIDFFGEVKHNVAPIISPLWFLRDLIILVVFSPVVYFLVRWLRGVLLLPILAAFIFGVWFCVFPTSTSCLFFSLGAYLALNKINIVVVVKKFRALILPVAIGLWIAASAYDGRHTSIGAYLFTFYILFGVPTMFLLASLLVERFGVRPNKTLVSGCFFIYASHLAFFPVVRTPLSIVNGRLHSLIPGNSSLEGLVCFICAPLLTAMLCLVMLGLLRKICPRIANVLAGNK